MAAAINTPPKDSQMQVGFSWDCLSASNRQTMQKVARIGLALALYHSQKINSYLTASA